MRKSLAVQEGILTIGMIVISLTLLTTQLPSMIKDIQLILSKESVLEKAKGLANLLSIASASPNEIKLTYSFPSEKSYDVSIKNGYVNVGSDNEWGVSKTLARNIECDENTFPECSKSDVQTLTITKNIEGTIRVE